MKLAVLSLVFCAVRLFGDTAPDLKFKRLQSVIPGVTVESDIAASFGKPTQVTDLTALPGSRESGELWEYEERDLTRLSVSFDPKSKMTLGWAWTVLGGDEEKDLKVALSRFPGASWEAETVKWVNPHQVPMECYFRDNKQGISIEFSRARKAVNSISRWNPSRKLSSEDDKPPRFCIENACSDAKLAKEVFKDKPLCELPK